MVCELGQGRASAAMRWSWAAVQEPITLVAKHTTRTVVSLGVGPRNSIAHPSREFPRLGRMVAMVVIVETGW